MKELNENIDLEKVTGGDGIGLNIKMLCPKCGGDQYSWSPIVDGYAVRTCRNCGDKKRYRRFSNGNDVFRG